MRVLLVEDDDRVGSAVADVLTHHGFRVDRAATAAEALELISGRTDVVVLDLGLPDRDGFEVCSRLRQLHDVPIIIATARGDLPSRVHGLHLGADDYLVKPFDFRELMARIAAVTRRARAGAPVDHGSRGVVEAHGLQIDLDRREVSRSGQALAMTRKEFDLVALLAARPGVVCRREQIVGEVWGYRWPDGQRTLEVHVASIRAKTGLPALIETVRGVGYRLGVPRPGTGPSGPIAPTQA